MIDQDRDGLIDEDPPRDLDGNGVITMMRRADPPLDDPPTHLPDPADDRLMITPDFAKGERATHTLYIEGIDADDDGLIGEDGPEGIDLQRNFMHRWPEYDQDSGPFPLSEYESSALARFILSRPNLIAAVVYGPHDNLIREPDTKGKDVTGRNPKELSGDDLEAHKKVAERYKALVGQERSSNIDSAGSLHGWLYAYRGVPTFASTGWGRPNPSEPGEDEGEGEEVLEPRDKEDGLWLAYSDRDRNGDGFVEWTAYDHPQLGAVEIGGWVPGFKSMPPPDSMDDLVAGHTSWLAELAAERATLEVTEPEIEPIGGGMTKLRIGVRNVGATATRSHQATRNRANRPTNIRLDCDPGQVIEGRMLTQVERIKPGELVTVEWTVRLRPGEPIAIEIDDPVLATNVVHNVEVDR